MKKTLTISSEQLHRVIVQFLLVEAQRQYFLVNRHAGIEESVLKSLLEENKRRLEPNVFELVNNTPWWRRTLRSIEDCGLNHFTVAKMLVGKDDTDESAPLI